MTEELRPILRAIKLPTDLEKKEAKKRYKRVFNNYNIISLRSKDISHQGSNSPVLVPITPIDPVQEVIKFWVKEGFKEPHKGTSLAKAVDQITRALNGSLFTGWRDCDRKYTLSEIKKSISNAGLAAFDRNYWPTGKFKNTLANMLLSRFFRITSALTTMSQSYFLHFLNNEPKLLFEQILETEDKYSDATKYLIKWFSKTFRGRNGSFSNKEILCFRRVTRYMMDFHEAYRTKLNLSYELMFHQHKADLTMVNLLTKYVESNIRSNPDLLTKYQPHWLLSEYLWGTYFPEFLRENKLMR